MTSVRYRLNFEITKDTACLLGQGFSEYFWDKWSMFYPVLRGVGYESDFKPMNIIMMDFL